MVRKGNTWHMIVSSAPEEIESVWEGPSKGQQVQGTERPPCICAHEKTLDFHVSHMGEQDPSLSSGYFTPAERRRETASCAGSLPWG